MSSPRELTRLEELKERLADLKARLPAHSIPPSMMMQLDELEEELAELRSAGSEGERAEEFGDFLFALVNLARWWKIDAESALRETNQKFRQRFAVIEREAKAQGRQLNEFTLDEMEAIWQSAKEK